MTSWAAQLFLYGEKKPFLTDRRCFPVFALSTPVESGLLLFFHKTSLLGKLQDIVSFVKKPCARAVQGLA